MPGPTLITIDYKLQSLNPHDRFGDAATWRGRLNDWECLLEDCRLQAQTTSIFKDVSAAREAIDERLRCWETVAFLEDLYEIRFSFMRAQDAKGHELSALDERVTSQVPDDAIFRRDNRTYPPPDDVFVRSTLVVDLLHEIRRFRTRDLQLPTAAHLVIERLRSGPAENDAWIESAAGAINAEPSVISTLAQLADRGHSPTGSDQVLVYRGPEWQWMQEAMRRLTLQAGRSSTEPSGTRLTMDSFESRL